MALTFVHWNFTVLPADASAIRGTPLSPPVLHARSELLADVTSDSLLSQKCGIKVQKRAVLLGPSLGIFRITLNGTGDAYLIVIAPTSE